MDDTRDPPFEEKEVIEVLMWIKLDSLVTLDPELNLAQNSQGRARRFVKSA